ncbi:MAG TPA: TULIP family P47-like protein [Myxococcota bacterium]|nr:TULIP family P47-like protein [Myxococcota bacterium]
MTEALGSGMTADTFGWDTVYAIHYADVNAAIVKVWPANPLHVTQAQGPVSIDGDFAPWRVVLGGSGHLLHVETPVPVLAYDGGSGGVMYDATVEIEVELEFVPQPANTRVRKRGGGKWMDLRVKAPAANAAVSVLDVTYAGAQPSDLDKAVIHDLFRQWFNDAGNLQSFNTVFASVNLNAKAEHDAFQWLAPTTVSYAVAEEAALPDGVFAVLCMTENRSATGLAHQVSAAAIPLGQRSAFLISRERYLRKLLLPGVALMFEAPTGSDPAAKWPEDYFEISDGGASLTNTRRICVPQLEIEPNNVREATIDSGDYVVRFEDTQLAIDITSMRHGYRAGLNFLRVAHTIRTTATATLVGDQKFALSPGDGRQSIVVTKDPVAEWVEIGVVGATLLLVVGGLAVGAYRTWRAGQAVVEANQMIQSGELAANAALPVGEAAIDEAAGAQAALGVCMGRVAGAGSFLRGTWSAYRATAAAGLSTAGAAVISILKMLEFAANVDSQHFLPDFDEFAAAAMAPVQWPQAQSEFTVRAVAFNGSLQAAGDPGFAD